MKTLDHHLLCNNLLCVWSFLSHPYFILLFSRLNKWNSFILALQVMFSKLLIIPVNYDKISPISVSFRKSIPSSESAYQYEVPWNKHLLNLRSDMILITFWNYICLIYKWTSLASVVPNCFLHLPGQSLHITYMQSFSQ